MFPLTVEISFQRKKSFNTPRYVELFLVVDNTEVSFDQMKVLQNAISQRLCLKSCHPSQYHNFKCNMDTVRERMLEVINHVDKVHFF